MRYLHTMVRVTDVDQSLEFYCNKLGMSEVRRVDSEAGRFTLIFLAANEDEEPGRQKRAPLLELTYNWDPEEYGGGRNFGHLAFEVEDIYAACQKLMDNGVIINRPPRDGRMAFVRSPDGISIELLQRPLQALQLLIYRLHVRAVALALVRVKIRKLSAHLALPVVVLPCSQRRNRLVYHFSEELD